MIPAAQVGSSDRSAAAARLGPILAAVLAGILAAPGFLEPMSLSVYDAGITASSGTFIDRPAGVRDTMYNPGVTTTGATQRRMVDDLEANDVRFLLIDERWSGCYETSNQSRVPGSTLLNSVIERDYRVVADYGAVVIMARRDVDVPPITPDTHLARTPPSDDGIVRCLNGQP